MKNLFKFSSSISWAPTIIRQIALQLTSAHSYGGRGRVGRNENVTSFEAILRISVAKRLAKIVIGFFWIAHFGKEW